MVANELHALLSQNVRITIAKYTDNYRGIYGQLSQNIRITIGEYTDNYRGTYGRVFARKSSSIIVKYTGRNQTQKPSYIAKCTDKAEHFLHLELS